MKLHQLNATYNQEQDRILVRMNTTSDEEIRLWLTRRFCHHLWPSLKKMVANQVTRITAKTDPARLAASTADQKTREMMADFHREEAVRSSDFKTPFRNEAKQYPLGNEPLLVTGVGLSSLSNGRLRIEWREKLTGNPTPRSFQMTLEDGNLQGFIHLLDQTLERTGWSVAAAPQTSEPEKLVMSEEKPRYLN